MTAFLKIASRRPCHLPSSSEEGELNICRSRGHEALIKKTERTMADSTATSRAIIPQERPGFRPLSPFLSLSSISSSPGVLIFGHPQFSESRAVKSCQALSGLVKRFSRKKIFFVFLSLRAALHRVLLFIRWPHFGRVRARRPNPKSILPYPKSTLDLRCEGLIWVENGLTPSLFPGCWHSFRPIMTREAQGPCQNQTAANQKKYFSKVDSGCEDFFLNRMASGLQLKKFNSIAPFK